MKLNSKTKDLTGLKFGSLIVVKFDGYKQELSRKRAYWLCTCDCGQPFTTRAARLLDGSSCSCGCRIGTKLPNGESRLNVYFGKYVDRAKDKKLPFNIDKSYFKTMVQKDCYYCGVAPKPLPMDKRFVTTINANGIDRVDNSKGYTSDNMVTCCWGCNRLKVDLSISNWKKYRQQLYKFRKLNIYNDTITSVCLKSLKSQYNHVKTRIKYRDKIDHNLTFEEHQLLVLQNCHYCDQTPALQYPAKHMIKQGVTMDIIYVNTIDRINSSMGYEFDNCVPSCLTCNKGKGNMSQSDFIKHLEKLINSTSNHLQ